MKAVVLAFYYHALMPCLQRLNGGGKWLRIANGELGEASLTALDILKLQKDGWISAYDVISILWHTHARYNARAIVIMKKLKKTTHCHDARCALRDLCKYNNAEVTQLVADVGVDIVGLTSPKDLRLRSIFTRLLIIMEWYIAGAAKPLFRMLPDHFRNAYNDYFSEVDNYYPPTGSDLAALTDHFRLETDSRVIAVLPARGPFFRFFPDSQTGRDPAMVFLKRVYYADDFSETLIVDVERKQAVLAKKARFDAVSFALIASERMALRVVGEELWLWRAESRQGELIVRGGSISIYRFAVGKDKKCYALVSVASVHRVFVVPKGGDVYEITQMSEIAWEGVTLDHAAIDILSVISGFNFQRQLLILKDTAVDDIV